VRSDKPTVTAGEEAASDDEKEEREMQRDNEIGQQTISQTLCASLRSIHESRRLTACDSAAGDPSVTHKMNLFLWYPARQLQALG